MNEKRIKTEWGNMNTGSVVQIAHTLNKMLIPLLDRQVKMYFLFNLQLSNTQGIHSKLERYQTILHCNLCAGIPIRNPLSMFIGFWNNVYNSHHVKIIFLQCTLKGPMVKFRKSRGTVLLIVQRLFARQFKFDLKYC